MVSNREVKGSKKKVAGLCVALFLSLIISCMMGVNVSADEGEESESFKVVYNVKKKPFGAKAGKDATEAIQKALDKAAKKGTASKRAKVFIPAGTYYISKTLEINSNTYLQCEKGTKIIKKKKDGKRILYMLRSAKNGKKGKKGYNNVKNITVDGGSWDAKFIKFSKETGGSLFFFVHGKNLEFKNLELKNNYGTHLLELGGVTDVDINNCKMHGFKKSVKKEEKEAIQLDVCHSYKVLPDGGPFDDTACSNITIENNEIYDYPRAIGSHTYVKQIYPDNILVRNNNFHDMTENAMYAYNYRNLTVSSNTFSNVGQAVVFKTTAPKAEQTIYNRNKGVKAMSLPGRNYNLKITDNTIKTTNKSVSANAEQFGIFIYGSKELSISGCTISGNTIKSASSGMYLKYINNSTIENNKTYRINNTSNAKFVLDAYKFLTCSNCTISGNTADNSSGNMYENGIAFRENCSNNTISGNTVINAQKHGIGVYNSTAVVSDNILTTPGQHGIAIVDGSTATVSGNTITSSLINGITITNKASATISGNTITSSGQNGISITDNGPTDIVGNVISYSGNNGITITNNAKANMSNNKITGSTQHGISITDNDSSTVTGNIISDNGGKGIIIANKGKASVVSDNKITGNKDRGLSIQEGTATKITCNELFDNNEKAIAINNSTVTEVSGNSMLSKNCEWEFTNEATGCPATNFRTVTLNPVSSGADVITGNCQQNAVVYAMINGQKYPGVTTNKTFTISITAQPAGTQAAVYQEDAYGNKVVVNVTF